VKKEEKGKRNHGYGSRFLSFNPLHSDLLMLGKAYPVPEEEGAFSGKRFHSGKKKE
jgi:hypothetical protein